ncbi:SMC-Scp complex subunit ScpB [Candidatus Bathyarchaeota archaeon]|nr:MAG: SMC-Scp complex subunit ScpB [Candidatus Bathyarchaeota archaeon]
MEASKSGVTGGEERRRGMVLIEAALYVAGRPLDIKTLCSVTGIRSKRRVRRLARELAREYAERNTALEILELEDGRFVLQLKGEYSQKVRRLAVRPLLTSGPLKTLSYIAYRQPVSQKEVVDVRGTQAYRHIRQLREMGLVEGERSGNTWILRTTEYFADYFGLSHNIAKMKRQLRSIFENMTRRNPGKGGEGES